MASEILPGGESTSAFLFSTTQLLKSLLADDWTPREYQDILEAAANLEHLSKRNLNVVQGYAVSVIMILHSLLIDIQKGKVINFHSATKLIDS